MGMLGAGAMMNYLTFARHSASMLVLIERQMTRHVQHSISAAVALALLAACSSPGSPSADDVGTQASVTADAATRSSPVVVGRPARVFVFAGVGKNCEPLAAPQITVTANPAKGDLSFKPGQETSIAASAQGTCVGQKSTGTGVYYTARADAEGTDRFTVEAKLASGEVSTRTFEVQIEH